ncbi:MAG: hypothetical protein ACUVV6_05805 [Thermoplasmatota archaeon]
MAAGKRALLALLPALLTCVLSPAASAAIGGGSELHVETQTQVLLREGGGYITWELSGPVVVDVRRNLDERMGDGDGNVTQLEGVAYTSALDSVLENYIEYGSVRIVRTALLTKDINADTSGLLGPVNSSAPITIHFYFNANLREESDTINLGDTRIPLGIFQALGGEENQSFSGSLDWRHTEILVGVASFSAFSRDRGELTHLRGPGVEVLMYRLALNGGEVSRDELRFDTFSAAQCSLELFIVVCVFGFVALWMPRRYMKETKMKKVRWLHWTAVLLVAALLLLFFFGVDGAAIWLLSPSFMVLSWALSFKVYARRWRGFAEPLAPALPAPLPMAPETPPPAPPQAAFTAQRDWQPVTPPEFPAGPAPPPPPAPAAQASAPLPTKAMRCPKCRAVFDVQDDGRRPLDVRCPQCGASGTLKT